MSIDAAIDAQRKQLLHLTDQLPKLRVWEQDLQSQIANVSACACAKRKMVRLQRSLRLCQKAIQDLESQSMQQDFERRLRPFLAAAQAKLNRRACDNTETRRLPGARKRQRTSTLGKFIGLNDGALYGSIMEEYRVEFMNQAPNVTVDCSASHCSQCRIEYIYVDRKSQATCPQCGQTKPFLDATTASLTYHSDVEFNMFSYKRTSHFVDWLSNTQGKESMVVSDEIMLQIMREMQRRRVPPERVDMALVRDVVKSLKLRKVYDHITQICCRLTGQPPPILRPQIEEMLKLLFHALLQPFEKHKGSRKNMLSYGYVLSKLVALIGITPDNVPLLQFAVLKGTDKLHKV
jgi:hypothetical protein